MIVFELRNVTQNSFRQATIDGVDKVIFTVTPEVGIVGCIYPFFTNTATQIEVICNKAILGTTMDEEVTDAAAAFVAASFPSI